MLKLDRDMKRIAAAAPQAFVSFITDRIAALRSCVDDGLITESSAIDHLQRYAKEIDELHSAWMSVDKDLEYFIEDSSQHKGFKKKHRTPLSVRTERGDFDSSNYTKTWQQEAAHKYSLSVVEHGTSTLNINSLSTGSSKS